MAQPSPCRSALARIDERLVLDRYERRDGGRSTDRSPVHLAAASVTKGACPRSRAAKSFRLFMERIGIEPMTSCLQSRRSPN